MTPWRVAEQPGAGIWDAGMSAGTGGPFQDIQELRHPKRVPGQIPTECGAPPGLANQALRGAQSVQAGLRVRGNQGSETGRTWN